MSSLDTIETKLQVASLFYNKPTIAERRLPHPIFRKNDIYLHLIAFTFLCYDHFLTFDTEVRLLWKRPNTRSSYLFFLNRYFSFFGNIGLLLSVFFSTELFHALVGIIVAILLTLRIYALYECDKRVLIILSVFLVGGIGLAIVTDLLAHSTKLPSSIPSAGCHDFLNLKNAALVAVGWEALFFYDLLLFGMTILKAYQAHSGSEQSITVNFLNVITFYVTGNSLLRAAFSPIASCMSVTLMSRLMLHLHEIASPGLYINHEKTIAPNGLPRRGEDESSVAFTTLWFWSNTASHDYSTRVTEEEFSSGSVSGVGVAGPSGSGSE
ncbi:hypothetical protein BT96DRAFT_989399 [Gymnopus androsaceus JB14]|uniref:DUF6533 domain-containing protein n=1 Tax=Gymnopus androsaceus JB14 TaxID=1447944 RepID=A0A6A4I6E9_9AGAR|nr:hypothetical protein BT96DRAFT_989399 [Gymnopus androsaceus JB14]